MTAKIDAVSSGLVAISTPPSSPSSLPEGERLAALSPRSNTGAAPVEAPRAKNDSQSIKTSLRVA